MRHAAALASSVALTHTAGVLVLGSALWTATLTAPERLYPFLGIASGAIITGLGAVLLLRARRGRHDHHHTAGLQAPDTPELRTGSIVALGFAGGMVPTPSALLILLGSLSVGRVWFGVLLIALYGGGMAAALVGFGVALACGKARLERPLRRLRVGRLHALGHALPSVTAAVVLVAGLALIARSAATV